MRHGFGVLGAALLTAMSLLALAATPAGADQFKSDANFTVTFSGTQETVNVLKTTAGSVECKTATFSGTSTSPRSTVMVVPSYKECTCLGVACTVELNGCVYQLELGVLTSGYGTLVCPAGKEVTITGSKCVIHIPAQTTYGSSTLFFLNSGSGSTKEVRVSIGLLNLKYSHTKGTGIGACTSGSGVDGSLSGSARATGVLDGGTAHVGLFVE